MSYKYHKDSVVGIRKMKWDQLWHVLYMIKDRLTWERVTKKEAMEVAKTIS